MFCLPVQGHYALRGFPVSSVVVCLTDLSVFHYFGMQLGTGQEVRTGQYFSKAPVNTQHYSLLQIAICHLWRQMPLIKDPERYTVDNLLLGVQEYVILRLHTLVYAISRLCGTEVLTRTRLVLTFSFASHVAS